MQQAGQDTCAVSKCNCTGSPLSLLHPGQGLPLTCPCFCCTGCQDGCVTVWDRRTRQPIRTVQKGGKGAVTALLVMDRPAWLAAGQGGRGEKSNSHAGSSSKKGPPRPQPLAPFSKYHGVAGGMQPWEGGPVVLDGSTPYRYTCLWWRLGNAACL